MELENSIALRPRFTREVPKSRVEILENASKIKAEVKEDFRVKISDHHIFFFITQAKRKYYSPHLHIELSENENKSTTVKGLFGPDQTVWTFFMFLHFIIAGIFIIFMVIAYSNWILKQSTTMNFVVMGLMVVFWFALYFQARHNRKKCQPQMQQLHDLMHRVVFF